MSALACIALSGRSNNGYEMETHERTSMVRTAQGIRHYTFSTVGRQNPVPLLRWQERIKSYAGFEEKLASIFKLHDVGKEDLTQTV